MVTQQDEVFRMVLVIITSYLLGSIPTAFVVAYSKGVNIFEVGSGNMGATNVIRALGFWWGVLVWLCDSFKGILAILLARLILPDHWEAATVVSAIVAVVGHNWSLFATLITGTLKGGKGAAIWFGTMLMLAPFQVFIGICLLGGLVIAATRYVSLAVLMMCALSTLWIAVLVAQQALPHPEYLLYFIAVAVMIVIRFRENIERLRTGTERRLGEPA